jgi:CheY-specific phosphatase CheX
MNVEYINPFIEAAEGFFSGKLKAPATQGETGISKGDVNVREFAAFVGFGGAVQGIVAMLVPVKTALAITSALERTQVVVVDDTVTNYLGDIIAAIAKDARNNFPDGGSGIKQTGSMVLCGSEFSEKYPGGVWLEVPFDSELGDFKLRVALR